MGVECRDAAAKDSQSKGFHVQEYILFCYFGENIFILRCKF